MRWVVNESNIISQEETKISIPYGSMGNICVAEDDSMILLVDDDRILHELDIERLDIKDATLATSMSSIIQNQLYCHRDHQVSSDGLTIVGCYIKCPTPTDTTTCDHNIQHPMSPDLRKTRVVLKVVDLSGDQKPTIELEYSDPYMSTSHRHVVILSPDLSLLQAGLHIFDLLASGHPQLYFSDSLLSNLWSDKGCVSFSACNGYLAIVKGEDTAAEGRKARVELFRIYRTAGRIEKIVIANVEGLVPDRIWAKFHPILPLLMLTYHTYPGTDARDTSKSVEVKEIDLQALESLPITLSKYVMVKRDE